MVTHQMKVERATEKILRSRPTFLPLCCVIRSFNRAIKIFDQNAALVLTADIVRVILREVDVLATVYLLQIVPFYVKTLSMIDVVECLFLFIICVCRKFDTSSLYSV